MIESIGTNGLRHWTPRERLFKSEVLPIGKISDPPNKKFDFSYDKRGKKKKTVPNTLDVKG